MLAAVKRDRVRQRPLPRARWPLFTTRLPVAYTASLGKGGENGEMALEKQVFHAALRAVFPADKSQSWRRRDLAPRVQSNTANGPS